MADVNTVTNNAEHVEMLWTSLIGVSTLLTGIVGVLYKRINDDIKAEVTSREKAIAEIQAKLDRGISTFSIMGESLIKIGAQIKALETKDSDYNKDFETHEHTSEKLFIELNSEIKKITEFLLILNIEHQRCMAEQEKTRSIKDETRY